MNNKLNMHTHTHRQRHMHTHSFVWARNWSSQQLRRHSTRRWAWVGSWHFYLRLRAFVLHRFFFFLGLSVVHVRHRKQTRWCQVSLIASDVLNNHEQRLCQTCNIDHTINRNTYTHPICYHGNTYGTHTHIGGRWGSGLKCICFLICFSFKQSC